MAREPFDIVIVGAGSAGAVIAARATEDPHRSVCLVEAGPDYPSTADTPYDLVNSHKNSETDHDWGFSYQPTRTGASRPFPRGKVTGGSSAVNTTIALRGMPEDYDHWASLGNPEWAWERVLPAFCRLERDLDYGHLPYHGDAGPITIRRYRHEELTPVHQAFLEASQRLGYPDCADANDPDSWGAGPHPMNKLGRVRISTAVGYLAPARIRPNLLIRANTLTRRVLFKDGRAAGIEVEQDGLAEVIDARLVVLCAGALQSPAILMRSGIGPPEELERHGIDVLRAVPGIGQNLNDHPALATVAKVKDGVLIDGDDPIVQTILRYTAPGSDQRNDLQIEQFSYSPRGGGFQHMAIAAVLEQAYSTGVIRLATADPHDRPITEQQMCEDPRDRERMVRCFRDTLAFLSTEPMASLVEEVTFPDPQRSLSEEDLGQLVLKLAASGFHPCGTVKMGPAGDPMAVVDQFGRAHAVENLVVADASIMPTVPRANTNLTSIMIGEKVGEWLRTQPAQYGL
jgi:choline dehydrogenase